MSIHLLCLLMFTLLAVVNGATYYCPTWDCIQHSLTAQLAKAATAESIYPDVILHNLFANELVSAWMETFSNLWLSLPELYNATLPTTPSNTSVAFDAHLFKYMGQMHPQMNIQISTELPTKLCLSGEIRFNHSTDSNQLLTFTKALQYVAGFNATLSNFAFLHDIPQLQPTVITTKCLNLDPMSMLGQSILQLNLRKNTAPFKWVRPRPRTTEKSVVKGQMMIDPVECSQNFVCYVLHALWYPFRSSPHILDVEFDVLESDIHRQHIRTKLPDLELVPGLVMHEPELLFLMNYQSFDVSGQAEGVQYGDEVDTVLAQALGLFNATGYIPISEDKSLPINIKLLAPADYQRINATKVSKFQANPYAVLDLLELNFTTPAGYVWSNAYGHECLHFSSLVANVYRLKDIQKIQKQRYVEFTGLFWFGGSPLEVVERIEKHSILPQLYQRGSVYIRIDLPATAKAEQVFQGQHGFKVGMNMDLDSPINLEALWQHLVLPRTFKPSTASGFVRFLPPVLGKSQVFQPSGPPGDIKTKYYGPWFSLTKQLQSESPQKQQLRIGGRIAFLGEAFELKGVLDNENHQIEMTLQLHHPLRLGGRKIIIQSLQDMRKGPTVEIHSIKFTTLSPYAFRHYHHRGQLVQYKMKNAGFVRMLGFAAIPKNLQLTSEGLEFEMEGKLFNTMRSKLKVRYMEPEHFWTNGTDLTSTVAIHGEIFPDKKTIESLQSSVNELATHAYMKPQEYDRMDVWKYKPRPTPAKNTRRLTALKVMVRGKIQLKVTKFTFNQRYEDIMRNATSVVVQSELYAFGRKKTFEVQAVLNFDNIHSIAYYIIARSNIRHFVELVRDGNRKPKSKPFDYTEWLKQPTSMSAKKDGQSVFSWERLFSVEGLVDTGAAASLAMFR